MPPHPSSRISLREIFNALVVLTGNEMAAESALLAGIESMPCGADHGEQLRDASLAAALCEVRCRSRHYSQAAFAATLPPELRKLTELPFALRSCFVLRTLMRLPIERCAELLNRSPDQIEDELQSVFAALAWPPRAMAACA